MSDLIEISTTERAVCIRPVGWLHGADYELIRPAMDALVEKRGSIRVLFEAEELDGWTPAAMWEDMKLGVHHARDMERIAFVVDRKWLEALAGLSGVFTRAEIRTFHPDEIEEAKAWIDAD
ncbi:MAG: STAS/SEC14 domain-containing protein [Phycisphaerae bacterium]|nr:STAS/SEC14 domain-containing protein [Phycisphaerae bacterium]